MPKNLERQSVEQQGVEPSKSNSALNSLDVRTAPVTAPITVAPEWQPQPPVEQFRVEQKPVSKNPYADVPDADLPRPNKDKTSAGAKLANGLEVPVTLTSGYFVAQRRGLNLVAESSKKLSTLSDHAVGHELATEFGKSRVQLTKELKSRYEASVVDSDALVRAEPHLVQQGCKFEFINSELSSEMISKLYRGNNIGEVINALDRIPEKDLTIGEVKEISDFTRTLSESPLLKDEGLTHMAAQIHGGANKLGEAMANPAMAEAKRDAENEMYGYIKNLRQEMGLRKYDAEEVVKAISKENPDLTTLGYRFEYDPAVSAEKAAVLRRPGQFNELLETVGRTYAPESKLLITSQGEHLAALKGLGENSLIKSEGLTGIASRLETNAAKVVEARVNKFDFLSKEQGTFMKKNMGLLGLGVATNWVVDRAFFNEHTPGIMSFAADIGAPMILLSPFSSKIKFGVIVGSHLLARLSEKKPV